MFMSVYCRFGKITRFIREGGIGSCAVFPLVVDRPKMLGILVGMNQKDSYAARVWPLVVDCGNGRYVAGFTGGGTIRAVFPLVVARRLRRRQR